MRMTWPVAGLQLRLVRRGRALSVTGGESSRLGKFPAASMRNSSSKCRHSSVLSSDAMLSRKHAQHKAVAGAAATSASLSSLFASRCVSPISMPRTQKSSAPAAQRGLRSTSDGRRKLSQTSGKRRGSRLIVFGTNGFTSDGKYMVITISGVRSDLPPSLLLPIDLSGGETRTKVMRRPRLQLTCDNFSSISGPDR